MSHLDLQIQTSTALDKLLPALLALQSELKPIERDGTGHRDHKYASLASINKDLKPLLQKHGFPVTNTMCVMPDGSTGMQTTLWHVSGQFIRGTMPLLLAANDPQSQGSGITYARRYALSALLDVVQEDDDGQQATTSRQAYQAQPKAASGQRSTSPPCPSCGAADSTHKSKQGSGFYCNPRHGGCGRAFAENEGEPDPQQDEIDRIFAK